MTDQYPDEQLVAKNLPSFTQEPPLNETRTEFTPQACLAILGAFFAMFCSVGYTNAFGVFQEYYSHTILSSHSASSISWLGSFNIFCLFGGTLISGFLNDKYGPRIILWTGSVIVLFALFMTSLCQTYYQLFLAQALLQGIGISLIMLPAIVVISQHFTRHRGLSLGIIVSGSSLGGVIWPIILRQLLTRIGFGWTVRTVAFIQLPLLLTCCLTIRAPKSHGPKEKLALNFRCVLDPTLILLAIGLFFVYLGLFTLFFYITSYATSLGLDDNLAYYLISILNAASLFGRILPGLLADRIGAYNVMVPAAALSGLICCCWTAVSSMAGVIILALAYGFASGALISLQGACAAVVVQPHDYGIAMGAVMSILSIAGLVGTPINGQILAHWGYLGVSLFSGFALFIGASVMCIARFGLRREIWAKV
ncbi:hypothetical protein BP6252_12674 [Coleophoma cylindrospora]|uniref:Major facilitator superfamily (MFS) profile domain-containing protein n=1 Tax=Coleophoma cylindrospora TaxID=1849047 RepID=A0A3D8QCZ2_9HELO|nr:hypothetical protein BP6252_12674 [Coleophoma cylindrospora]